jgi:hypothetical protein
VLPWYTDTTSFTKLTGELLNNVVGSVQTKNKSPYIVDNNSFKFFDIMSILENSTQLQAVQLYVGLNQDCPLKAPVKKYKLLRLIKFKGISLNV